MKFLVSAPATGSLVEETYFGEAANKLYEMTRDPDDSDDPLPVGEPFWEDLFFRPGITRTKGWYYHEYKSTLDENRVRRYFLAFVNSKGSCSIRTFDADTGRFEGKKYRRGHYPEVFADIIDGASELTVKSQPNLELGSSNDERTQAAL